MFKVGHHSEKIHFQIEDTGIGIAAQELEEILQPFEQAGDQARMTEGTSLGLAISSKLTALMSGDLQIHSQLGECSTFWFELNLN